MKTVIVILAALMLQTTAGAQKWQRDSDKPVFEIVQEMADAPNIDAWFASNKQRISPELAEAAADLASRALANEDPETAKYAAWFAAGSYSLLGNRGKELEAYVITNRAVFALSEKPEDFETPHKANLVLAQNAESMSRPDLAFSFYTMAEECSYFAAGKASDHRTIPLMEALKDAEVALKYAKSASTREELENVVAILASISTRLEVEFLTDENQKELKSLYKNIAAEVEAVVPADFEFKVLPGFNYAKNAGVARTLANISYEYGSPQSAKARLIVAADRAKKAGDASLWVSLTVNRYLGEVNAGFPPEEIRQLGNSAWDGEEAVRASYSSRAGRIWEEYHADNLFGSMLKAEFLFDPSSPPGDIFRGTEAIKARMMLDALRDPEVMAPPPPQAAALERQVIGFNKRNSKADDLSMSETRLVSQLSFFDQKFERDSDPRHSALLQLQALDAGKATVVHQSVKPARLEDVQGALQPREGIVEFVLPYESSSPGAELWALFITQKEFRTAHVYLDDIPVIVPLARISADGQAPVDFSPLNSLVVNLRVAIQTGDEQKAQRYLRELHQLLIQPLLDQGVRFDALNRLIIVPDGVLHYVPFAALIDKNGKYLINTTAVTIVPSASIWRVLSERDGPVRRFVGIGDPNLQGRTSDRLRFASQEIKDIAKLVSAANPTILVDSEATEDALEQEAQLADILHISTHGEFPDEDATDLHAILLGKGKVGDGTVRAARVRTLKLSTTRLVVLSVCNGGVYRIGPGDEPYGLVPAFLEAGSQNVVGTLWNLDDEFAKSFMEEFYKYVLQDGPAEAYRKACLHFLARDESLRNWAGFAVVGPGRPFTRPSN
jgi:CHAT domain-containing protein